MNDFEVLDVKFTFKRRPLDLPCDLRPNWRVPLLLLMLHMSSRGGKSSLYRLHLMNWTIRDKQRQADLLTSLSGHPDYSKFRIQVEPSFVQALQYAVGEGLVERVGNNRVKLSSDGRNFATDVEKSDCLGDEKAFLKSIGTKFTEEWVAGFSTWSRTS